MTFVRCELTDNNNNLLCVAVYMPNGDLNCADFVFIHSFIQRQRRCCCCCFFFFRWEFRMTDIFFCLCVNVNVLWLVIGQHIKSINEINDKIVPNFIGKSVKRIYPNSVLCREWNNSNETDTVFFGCVCVWVCCSSEPLKITIIE